MRSHLPVIVLFSASILWGLSWWPLKQIHALGIEGIALIFGAYGVLALVYLPLTLRGFSRRYATGLGAIALLGGGANLCFTYALINGDVVRVMVLFYLLPVWGVLGGYFFLHEKLSLARVGGAWLAVAGAFLILGGVETLHVSFSTIDLIALAAGIFFALNNILFRSLKEVDVNVKVGAMFWGCFVLASTLILLGVERFPSEVGARAWAALLAYALLWLLLANIGSQWGVTQMEAGRSSIIIIMELVTAVVSAAYIGERALSFSEYTGGALVVSAALIEALSSQEE
ncbi:MAG: DMT family transporter [Epsilonproteobacteria bacterium]|nr:DMT family transporter [Campylobacterota bacterium]